VLTVEGQHACKLSWSDVPGGNLQTTSLLISAGQALSDLSFTLSNAPGTQGTLTASGPDIVLGDHEEEDWTAGSPQGPKQNPAEVGRGGVLRLGTRRYELHPSPLLNDPLLGIRGACRRPTPRLWNQEWRWARPAGWHGASRPWWHF
jgi:hypothetical protein